MEAMRQLYDEVETFDVFQVKHHLNRLCVPYASDEHLQILKLSLKKAILSEIMKVDGNNINLNRDLETVVNLLGRRGKLYSCCLVGCRFQCHHHRNYIKHMRRSHPRYKGVRCNFHHKCLRTFDFVADLVKHIKEDHCSIDQDTTPVRGVQERLNCPCKCSLYSCGSPHFQNVKSLLTHLNTVHLSEPRECVFEGCFKKFASGSESRYHFRRQHLKCSKISLKTCNRVDSFYAPIADLTPGGSRDITSAEDVIDPTSSVVLKNPTSYNDHELIQLDSSIDMLDDEKEGYFLDYYADFLNRLVHEKYIPQSTVQDIAEEFLESCLKANKLRLNLLRSSMKESQISEDIIDVITDKVTGNDYFLEVQEQLNTPHKRIKYVRDHMKYVAPIEIVLNKSEVLQGRSKDVIHYVPLTESIKNLLEDPSCIKMMKQFGAFKEVDDDSLNDIVDGELYKNNRFIQNNQNVYGLMLYSDGVELKNPLGAARGTYKVVQVFYTLIDFPKDQRVQVDRLQLAMIFREKLLKKYSYAMIYKKMVDDLLKLESGITVNLEEPSTIKVGLLLHAADNLEAHLLSGMSTCFSSKSICRFCHVQYDQLDSNIHDYDGAEKHKRWTAADYDQITRDLLQEVYEADDIHENMEEVIDSSDEAVDYEESDDSHSDVEEIDNHGVKFKCPLNVLDSFHCVLGFPPDLMHDVLEVLLDLYILEN